jgi:hypothetical protein
VRAGRRDADSAHTHTQHNTAGGHRRAYQESPFAIRRRRTFAARKVRSIAAFPAVRNCRWVIVQLPSPRRVPSPSLAWATGIPTLLLTPHSDFAQSPRRAGRGFAGPKVLRVPRPLSVSWVSSSFLHLVDGGAGRPVEMMYLRPRRRGDYFSSYQAEQLSFVPSCSFFSSPPCPLHTLPPSPQRGCSRPQERPRQTWGHRTASTREAPNGGGTGCILYAMPTFFSGVPFCRAGCNSNRPTATGSWSEDKAAGHASPPSSSYDVELWEGSPDGRCRAQPLRRGGLCRSRSRIGIHASHVLYFVCRVHAHHPPYSPQSMHARTHAEKRNTLRQGWTRGA